MIISYIVAFSFFTTSIMLNTYWLSALGIGMFSYFLTRLLFEIGRDIPIESLILVIASLQWILGPLMAYEGYSSHYKYYMYVPEDEYMRLAVPGVLFLAIGLYAFRSDKRVAFLRNISNQTKEIVLKSKSLPYYLITIGFFFSLFGSHFPSSLAFPIYLLTNIKYIGIIYLLFSTSFKNKKVILFIVFILTFITSLKGALFHDFLLWMTFIGIYAAIVLRPSLIYKLLIITVAMLLIFVLQSAKEQYRNLLQESGQSGYIEKFITSVDDSFTQNEDDSNNVEKLVNRINQGWIISKIIERVPNIEPHTSGETIITAIKASLLPRFLYPDKPIAGGRANYEKYTGFPLTSSTSMGISLLGEAYINFGVVKAWIFMLFFGLFTSFVILQLFKLAYQYPTIWLWLPLIFLHFVKAETELLVQLNFLIKSIILVYAFVYINKNFLNIKL